MDWNNTSQVYELDTVQNFTNSSSTAVLLSPSVPDLGHAVDRVCLGSPWYSFWIGGIATSSLCIFAIFGNLICMIILSRRSMRSSVNCILLALSCSDLISVTSSFIIRGIPRTMQHFCVGKYFTDYFQPFGLPYIFPIGTTAQVCSVYFVVLVSMERFIAVCRPFKARIWCTCKRSYIFCLIVIIFSILYNLPTWWELETRPRMSFAGNGTSIILGYRAKKTSLYSHPKYIFYYVNWGSFFVIRCIPFTLLTALNLMIYRQIHRMNQQRQAMTQSQVQDVSIAKILFCIVIIFLLCNVVTIIAHMLDAFGFHRPNELTSISNFLVLVNSAVNFVIYSLLNKNFRKVMIKFVKSKCPVCWGHVLAHNGSGSTTAYQTEMSNLNRSKWEQGKNRLHAVHNFK